MILYICLQMYNKLCYEDRISAFKFTGALLSLVLIYFFRSQSSCSFLHILQLQHNLYSKRKGYIVIPYGLQYNPFA